GGIARNRCDSRAITSAGCGKWYGQSIETALGRKCQNNYRVRPRAVPSRLAAAERRAYDSRSMAARSHEARMANSLFTTDARRPGTLTAVVLLVASLTAIALRLGEWIP